MSYQHGSNVETTLCNVDSTFFQRRVPMLYQRCTTLKIWHRILFDFQRRINVISTLIHNVDPTLKCWLGTVLRKRETTLDVFL